MEGSIVRRLYSNNIIHEIYSDLRVGLQGLYRSLQGYRDRTLRGLFTGLVISSLLLTSCKATQKFAETSPDFEETTKTLKLEEGEFRIRYSSLNQQTRNENKMYMVTLVDLSEKIYGQWIVEDLNDNGPNDILRLVTSKDPNGRVSFDFIPSIDRVVGKIDSYQNPAIQSY